jgi:hypothetical protein
MTTEQLTLPFETTPEPPDTYTLTLWKDNEPQVLSSGTFGDLVKLRFRLVARLQENPLHRVKWDKVPRPTGWFGVATGDGNAHFYELSIRSDDRPPRPRHTVA